MAFKRFAFGLMIVSAIGLTGCDNSKKTESDKVEVDKVVEKEEKKIGNKYESLSDEDIKKAIEEGKKGMDYYTSEIFPRYELESFEGNKELVRSSIIKTPYYLLSTMSMMKSTKYQELSDDEIRDICDEVGNKMVITSLLVGETLDFHNHVHIVMKQDGLVLQPESVEGSDGMAAFSGDILAKNPYESMLNFQFDIKDLDTDKEAEVIIVYNPTTEIKYKIDFSKYK